MNLIKPAVMVRRMKNIRFSALLVLGLLLPPLVVQSTSSGGSTALTNPHFRIHTSSSEEGRNEGRLLSNIRQLTFQGRRSGEGYFSPDGSMLVFQGEREAENPFFQIYLMNLKTGHIHRVSPGYGKTTCAWIHPTGQKVLFASTHEDPNALLKQKEELRRRASGKTRRYSWDYDEYFDIYETNLQAIHLKNLTKTQGYDAEASWSPDGKLIVFSSNRHAYSQKLPPEDQTVFEHDKSYMVDLYLMDADGNDVRRLTDAKGYDGGAFFSPDGQKICWRRFSEDGTTAEIYTMRLDDWEDRQITRLGAMSWAPYFHPSGDYLIFATNLHGFGDFELYLVDAKGKTEPVRVTHTDGFDSLPVFSPDGKQLVWTSNRTANRQSQLFTAEWNNIEAGQMLGLDVRASHPEISAQDLHLHVSYLASDQMEGRLTGTEGARRATEYVASVFQSLGLEPAGDNGTYFQSFEFTSGVSLGSENRLRTLEPDSPRKGFVVDQDWRPLAFSKTGVFDPAGIVFAGYGIAAPGTDQYEQYDSFVHLDVRDKWVMVFRYLPENISPEFRQHLARYSSLRYKVMTARDRGARGLIVLSGPNSQVKQELVRLSFDGSVAGTSIGAISVTDDLAQQLLKPSGKNLQDLQDQLDKGGSVMGFQILDLELEIKIDIQQEKRIGRNVLARLRALEDSGEVIVVGAHVDHLGHGLGAGSLAREEEKDMIHYGADDNASGVGGLLEIAQYLADLKTQGKLPMKRDLLVAAWSGEEQGRLGSSYFTELLAKQKETSGLAPPVAAYLNLDMIGRLRKSLILQGVGSSSIWLGEIERYNIPLGLPIVIQNDSYLPTDATSFYLKGVPILSAFTGAHQDYHTPRDAADKINYEGAEKVARLMALITRSLLTRKNAPQYIEMEKPESSMRRANLRTYLGTVPDYSQSDVTGVKLSGVIKRGPAEQAGVRGGDIIIELAGKKIENIYDYTYTLEALKVGVAVKMVVMRKGERLTLTITPASRE
ncbi:M28 family peptidase [Acidobacteria bacterium AH-259-L09]|nr:M28 family peptidase [Acidobacteria bacterium AH-259-L09]